MTLYYNVISAMETRPNFRREYQSGCDQGWSRRVWPLTITLSIWKVYLIISSWHSCLPEANSLMQKRDTDK